MQDYKLDQQTMDEMTEVLLRRLRDRLNVENGEFKLVSMDILCDVKEGELLTQATIFFNTDALQVHNRP
ncbi:MULTISPECIES: hypothetical protein [unclassified Exiguobacterium]|uniref:hypothetical protein n=1 Tax=unclassified Exiguobacterium TaxID=2644629 RepID=UPI00103B6D96|nr:MULTISPECIES: hypothetical protein [unclassified Exiguobacterium]TCI42962.1 hypothetical protein EVJ31_13230 [Exiguobacterium sp. SH5S32]TCI49702.1 hypothetical protein EVJ25_13770 [Exiguobacterium sp. SH1S4]TCI67765.1 hypothetical protein EVJ23_13180 [Exiguobacterium sp. SH1S1]